MSLRKFDTKVQHLKYKVIRQVAKHVWQGDLAESVVDIPKEIVPGKTPTMRCCVYKERAILSERIKLIMSRKGRSERVINVIDIACDECPAAGYEVTDSCRGCLAHRCEDVCKRGAIVFDQNHVAYIDKSKCVECGACAKVCPFFAIVNRKRPCQNACKVKALSINHDGAAHIDPTKCIACGSCVYQCPFGAVMDRSFILDVIGNLMEPGRRVYAVLAPAFASQFAYASPGQVVRGLEMLGFHKVCEAAMGADMASRIEAAELAEKGFLISSCCPAFVSYVEKNFPDLAGNISTTPSPMVLTAKHIKAMDPECRIVFIGPCTAKKEEAQKPEVIEYVDAAITFEELQALFDSKEIELTALESRELDDASVYGRNFARSGGLAEAVKEAISELNIDFEVKPVVCDGIEACRTALLRANKGVSGGNFIEGMACIGGCIGGAGCLTHGERNRAGVERFSAEAKKTKITDFTDTRGEETNA